MLAAGAALDCTGAVAYGVVAVGGADIDVVVAVCTFAGDACVACGGTAAVVAGCSVACWFAVLAARLRLREPPA